jgi:hypothetical protein
VGGFLGPSGTGLRLMQINKPASTKMKTRNLVNSQLRNSANRSPSRLVLLKSSAAKQEAIATQQQEKIKALTASLKEQATQIRQKGHIP